MVAANTATSTPGATAERLEGPDRYATAAAIARTLSPAAGDRRGVVVTGEAFADALSASGVAGLPPHIRGPVVLTTRDALHPEALAALRAVGVTIVDILGGDSAVSAQVEQQLRAEGFDVRRQEGADRYETAAKASNPERFSDVPSYADGIAFVASGESFADALAAGPLSWKFGYPVLLTRRDELPEVTRAALAEYASKVYVLGGEAVVSRVVEEQIRQACRDFLGSPERCIEVERIAGGTRSETAVKLAELAVARGWPLDHVNIARGDHFPDALSGGPHGGFEDGPILLTESSTTLGTATRDFLRSHSATVESIHVFGNSAAVSDAVVAEAVAAARGT